MDMKCVQKRCEARLRDLPIPIPFDVHVFAEQVAARRGRPIVLHPMLLLGSPFGACVPRPAADYVVYEQDTTPLHRQHIIVHELCHLICGHLAVGAGDSIAFRSAASPDEPQALPRATYDDDDEQEVEMLTTLILVRVYGAQANTAATDPDVVGVLHLLDCLEGLNSGG